MAATVATPLGGSSANDDDAALVHAAQRDPRAFAALYERYFERLHFYLLARSATAEDAADLMQQTFLRALDSLPGYRDRGVPFSAWLYRIARNAEIDLRRRRRPTVPWEDVPEPYHPDSGQDVEAAVLGRERVAKLRALVGQLDAEQREIVLLRFVAGLTMREIAAVVNKSDSTVHRQLTRSLAYLKERALE